MNVASASAAAERVAHERRIVRRLEARGERGLGEALAALDGSVLGGRFRLESLYAVGSEGAVYACRDLAEPDAPIRVAKTALLPLHRPFDLTDAEIRVRRDALREEAASLASADSRYLPRSLGLHEFTNRALDAAWGGEFAAPEPALVMERVPGFDLDVWLARMHRSPVRRDLLRRQLDHLTVVVLSGLMDLQDRGYYYTDLRPGNVRVRGRTRERIRLLDGGSLVRVSDLSGRFPHVPAYLPPALFEASRRGETLLPSSAAQAVMAGRTLYEVATGHVPVPGEDVDLSALVSDTVSRSVGDTIGRLCSGEFPDVTSALAHLSERFLDDRPAAPPPAPVPAAAPRAARPEPPRDLRSALARVRPDGLVPPAPHAVPLAQARPGHAAQTGDPAARRESVRSPSERNLRRLYAGTPLAAPAPPAPAPSAAPPPAPARPAAPADVPRLVAEADTETATVAGPHAAGPDAAGGDAILPEPRRPSLLARLRALLRR